MSDDLSHAMGQLEQRLGVHFHDRDLLLRALTHHSAVPEDPIHSSYDRLEFLGDAIIGARVVEHLYRAYPDANEGKLTALKSEVVSRRVFARIGLALGIDHALRVDVASLRTFNERSRDSLSADVLEALVGAIFLDQGRTTAEQFIDREIVPIIAEIKSTLSDNNPKGTLQQHVLRQTGTLPRYEVVAQSGQDNDRTYTVGVYVGERLLATGSGSSIKEAGREAARAALAGDLSAEQGPA